MKTAIWKEHSLRVGDLVLVSPGSIPITTSGKIRRSSCADLYRDGEFNRLDISGMTSEADAHAELRLWLVDYLVTNLSCDPAEIDPDAPFNELGVGSRDAVVLSGELSEHLGQPVSPVDFWQNPTINALATALLTPESRDGGAVRRCTAGYR